MPPLTKRLLVFSKPRQSECLAEHWRSQVALRPVVTLERVGLRERAVYHPGYYGAFVLDPDGHNVEVVNHNR